ncbi:MAG: type IV secretory system conjugative DNA transfer family protein [Candidatus Izemoplasmatales bacterium]
MSKTIKPAIFDEHKYNMYLKQMATGSRFATENEMKFRLKKILLNESNDGLAGVPIISDGRTVYVDDQDNHTLILGSTGSKKTRLFCMPLINILAHASESMIITDPKGELLERNSGYLLSQGYRIEVLNFRDPKKSNMYWNPLYKPYQLYKSGEFDKAIEMVSDFVNTLKAKVKSEKDPYWEITSANYIVGVILLLFELAKDISEVNMKSVVVMAAYAQETNEVELSNLAKFVKDLPKQSLAAIKMLSTLLNADNTRKSILGTVDTMLSPFMNSKSLNSLLSKTSFDIANISKEKTAVFLVIPDEKTTLHFLASSFIKQSYEVLIDEALKTKERALIKRVNFCLDEFANMPKITDMPSIISAARSRNMRFFLVVQSEQQLFNIYQEEAQTIKGNCTNWIFLTSREKSLLEEIQTLCGKRMVFNREEPLISISQLQMLDKQRGQALILQGRNFPYVSYLSDIDDYKVFQGFNPIIIEQLQLENVRCFDFESFYDQYRSGKYQTSDFFKHEFDQEEISKHRKYEFLRK